MKWARTKVAGVYKTDDGRFSISWTDNWGARVTKRVWTLREGVGEINTFRTIKEAKLAAEELVNRRASNPEV